MAPHAKRRDYIWGVAGWKMGVTPPKTNFNQVLDHSSGFENYTFFDFQEKIFSLHPIVDIQMKAHVTKHASKLVNAIFAR